MFVCKYCGKEFKTAQKLGGHVTHCKLNPNYKKNIKSCNNLPKNISLKQEVCFCKYCGKQVGNIGCLILHEKRCKLNPNYVPTIKQQLKIDKQKNKQPYTHSIETRKKLSEIRKHWLLDNKDKHVWKYNTKFLSKPCESVKQFLKDNNINFVEEYSPFDDYNYSIDIAFPDKYIGIEINGNQHYNNDGELKEYYLNRHNLFKDRGWKLYEIHYSICFDYSNDFFNNLLTMNLENIDYTNYVNQQYIKKHKNKLEKEKIKAKLIENKIKEYNTKRNILINAYKNSGIDFTKSGWSTKLYNWLLQRNELFNKVVFRALKKYYPEFFNNDIWIRKGSILPK